MCGWGSQLIPTALAVLWRRKVSVIPQQCISKASRHVFCSRAQWILTGLKCSCHLSLCWFTLFYILKKKKKTSPVEIRRNKREQCRWEKFSAIHLYVHTCSHAYIHVSLSICIKRSGGIHRELLQLRGQCFFYNCVFFYWSVVDSQGCVNFYSTAKWFSYTYIDTFYILSYCGLS